MHVFAVITFCIQTCYFRTIILFGELDIEVCCCFIYSAIPSFKAQFVLSKHISLSLSVSAPLSSSISTMFRNLFNYCWINNSWESSEFTENFRTNTHNLSDSYRNRLDEWKKNNDDNEKKNCENNFYSTGETSLGAHRRIHLFWVNYEIVVFSFLCLYFWLDAFLMRIRLNCVRKTHNESIRLHLGNEIKLINFAHTSTHGFQPPKSQSKNKSVPFYTDPSQPIQIEKRKLWQKKNWIERWINSWAY